MRFAGWMMSAALVLAGGRAMAQDVSFDYDRGRDFTAIKTYAWADERGLPDEYNHKRIVSAIEAQLAAKGLARVERTGAPDVLISYRTRFANEIEVNGYSSGAAWPGYRFGSQWGTARAEQVLVGTLLVEMVDANSGAGVWRGVATRDIDTKASPEKRDKSINKAAEKLFKNYPPKK